MPDYSESPEEIRALLETETLAYRDELHQTGDRLTVEDTRRALAAFERLVKGESMLGKVTAKQYKLAKRYYSRIVKGR